MFRTFLYKNIYDNLKNKQEIFICSKSKDLDLIELDQLLQTVG